MAVGPLSIKLRCTSWQQLATIYRRDLSRGTMFLKASAQPPLGTVVRIDLELPSATVLELTGTIAQHVVDPQRGTGVELTLEPLPTKTVWLIESALSAENKVRAQTGAGVPQEIGGPADVSSGIAAGGNHAQAEADLIRALEAEAESLKKLNPFLVLGLGYEVGDVDVRGAFGELTKRYHPDRFARYQSSRLRQIAAEIFILIRDAYRKLSDEPSRTQVRAQLGVKLPRARTPPHGVPRLPTGQMPQIARVPPATPKSDPPPEPGAPPKPTTNDAPTNPSSKSAAIASTQLARASDIPVGKSEPLRRVSSSTSLLPSSQNVPVVSGDAATEANNLEALIDQGKLDDALAGYRAVAKRNSQDRGARAGIELVEGLKSLQARDRLEAAQRFETALEIDPSNERAARELADMRRQATNERKGLLSRLMGKKEGPT